MGLLTNFLQKTFRAALGVVIGATIINILFDVIMVAVPNFLEQFSQNASYIYGYSGQAAQLLSYIYGLSLITFLIGLANNPFFGAIANAVVGILVAIIGEIVSSNLSSSPQIFAQNMFIVAYTLFIYFNAIFFFAYSVPLLVKEIIPSIFISIMTPGIMIFDYIFITIFLVAVILCLLIASGLISP